MCSNTLKLVEFCTFDAKKYNFIFQKRVCAKIFLLYDEKYHKRLYYHTKKKKYFFFVQAKVKNLTNPENCKKNTVNSPYFINIQDK